MYRAAADKHQAPGSHPTSLSEKFRYARNVVALVGTVAVIGDGLQVISDVIHEQPAHTDLLYTGITGFFVVAGTLVLDGLHKMFGSTAERPGQQG